MLTIFYGCYSLTSLNLSINTNNANNMLTMFSNCSSLTFLNLSNFNIKKVKHMSNMFHCLKKNCKMYNNDLYLKTICKCI